LTFHYNTFFIPLFIIKNAYNTYFFNTRRSYVLNRIALGLGTRQVSSGRISVILAKYRDWATRVLQRTSVSSKFDSPSLEHYHDEGGYLKLDEQSVIDSAGPTELVGTGTGHLLRPAYPRWKIFVKRRSQNVKKSHRARVKHA
jgi:hypothetical protein